MEKNNNILTISILKSFNRNKLLFLGVLAISICISSTVIHFTVKKYSISSTILVDSSSNTNELFTNQIPSVKESSKISNEMLLLQSRSLLRHTLIQANSYINYSYKNILNNYSKCDAKPFDVKINQEKTQLLNTWIKVKMIDANSFDLSYAGTSNNLGLIDSSYKRYDDKQLSYLKNHRFEQQINTKELSIKISRTSQTEIGKEFYFIILPVDIAELQIKNSITITPFSKKADLIKVSINHNDINQAIKIVNTLTALHLKKDIKYEKTKFSNKVNFIAGWIDEIDNKLSISEEKLKEFQSRNKSIDLEYTSKKLYDKLFSIESKRKTIEFKLSYYKNLEKQLTSDALSKIIIPSVVGIDDKTLNSLVYELSNIHVELKDANTKYNITNPIYTDRITRLKYLKENILSIITSSIISIEDSLKETADFGGKIEKEVNKLPSSQSELIKIKREFELNNQLYTFLLEKRAEASIEMTSAFSNKRIIDSAMLDDQKHTYPNNKKIHGLTIFLCLGALILFLVIKVILFGKIDSVDILKQINPTGTLIGDVPHCKIDVLNDQGQISPKTLLFEKLRIINLSLELIVGPENKAPIFGITSYIQGEGKSFISKNLGYSMSLSDKKVLLINADLRKKMDEDQNKMGLSNYLSGTASINEIIQPAKFGNCDFISNGPLPTNPSFLLGSERFSEFLQKLKSEYDYIFIDLPPIAIIADWNLIKPKLDHTVFIIRDNYSPFSSLEKLIELKNNNISTLFNDVLEENPHYSYYH